MFSALEERGAWEYMYNVHGYIQAGMETDHTYVLKFLYNASHLEISQDKLESLNVGMFVSLGREENKFGDPAEMLADKDYISKAINVPCPPGREYGSGIAALQHAVLAVENGEFDVGIVGLADVRNLESSAEGEN
jgi:hypothetical protein